jgi:hypothetical protein
MRGRRDQRGTALVEVIWLGILLLIPMLWILLSAFEVQKGALGTSTAARAAGRAYVLAPNAPAAQQRAEAAARLALADQGITGVPVTVTVTCRPVPTECLSAASVVTVHVSTSVDLPLMPRVLGGDAPSFALDASHTVPVGQYRESGQESDP